MPKDGLDLSAWNDFWGSKYWQRVIKIIPEAKHAALFEAGKALMQEVNAQIDQRGVNDKYGRVRSWTTPEVGSGNGYVAVRPDDVTVTTEGGTGSSKQITQYLEHGHGVRLPSGRAKRYVPEFRGNGSYVRGYLFYSFSRSAAERIGIQAAEKCLVKFENAIDDILGDDYGWEDD